ncbi:hypothetical protein GK047_11480 [Paenibacillus sp. SYP-B3998]|uniref:Uncharacterized protein n=1 Tax=Paenibacillus sp. SYP-B3998 TaxID=2678564 RepID=A0A6G3ZWZ4_9BACL|nr:hypothetical protein [Paenibacillus sp. SYP-B3998]NEW06635.1 hypothetical protein [Paenibacillus sp. SYP-B3998]
MLVGVCVLLISIVIAWVEIPRLWRAGNRKEVWVYGSLLLLGNVLATLKGMNKPLPNPAEWISIVLMPLSKVLAQIGLLKW